MEARMTRLRDHIPYQSQNRSVTLRCHINFLSQLHTQVNDLQFLLKLPEEVDLSTDDLGLDKAVGHLNVTRLLNRVLKYLGQEMGCRRCSALILKLRESSLESISQHDRFGNAAATFNSDTIQRLKCGINSAIQQNLKTTKDILLAVEVAKPGDFGS